MRRLVTHDEGSCWVPAELRSSIILSHWGRKVCLWGSHLHLIVRMLR